MLLAEAKPIFRYVYHITNKSNLANIRQHGLIAVDKSPGKHWGHLKYEKPSIFVITRNTPAVINEILSMMVGREYTSDELDAGADPTELFDNLVLITIDITKCTNVDLVSDPSAGRWVHSKILYGEVPPNAIVRVEPVKMDYTI